MQKDLSVNKDFLSSGLKLIFGKLSMLLLELSRHPKKKKKRSISYWALLFERLHMISLTGQQDLLCDILLLVVEYSGELCLNVHF